MLSCYDCVLSAGTRYHIVRPYGAMSEEEALVSEGEVPEEAVVVVLLCRD